MSSHQDDTTPVTPPTDSEVPATQAPATDAPAPDTAPVSAAPDTEPDGKRLSSEHAGLATTAISGQALSAALPQKRELSSRPPSEHEPQTTPSPGTGSTKGLDPATLIASLLVCASLIMVLWNLQDASLRNANTGSRFATIESLVDHGTFYIDKSQYRNTIDKVKVGDHFLSSKPPTLPTYAAGTYWLYQKLTGFNIKDHEGPVVWFVSLCTGWLFHLIFLIYFYRFCRLLVHRQLALIGSLAAACFSYLGVAYATAINNHSIGASLALVGFYYVYRIGSQRHSSLRHWVIAGLVFGFMPAIDLPCAAFVPFAAWYLSRANMRRTLIVFLPLLLPGALTHLVLGYLTTGSLIPAYFNSELKDFESNYFRGKQSGIDALREPKHIYAFNVLLGHHGLFSMTPLFVFSVWEAIHRVRKGTLRRETLGLAIPILIISVFYILRTRNYGGWCVGMRHLVPIMPFLLLYFALWLERVAVTRWLWAAVIAAFGVGAFHVQDGLTSPFQFSVWHNFLEDEPNRGRVGKKLNLPKKKKQSSGKKRGSSRGKRPRQTAD